VLLGIRLLLRGESKPERRSGKRIIAGTAFQLEFLVCWYYDADATMAVPVGCRFSLTRPNSSLCGQRELAIGLQLQQKDQNGIAISHCCNQVGAKGAAYPQILDGKY